MPKSKVFEKNYSTLKATIYGFEIDFTKYPKTMQNNMMVDGGILKLTRTTAGMKLDTYSNEERLAAIKECHEHLMKDQWTKPGEGKGSGKQKVAELQTQLTEQAQLLADTKIALEEAQAVIAKLTKK